MTIKTRLTHLTDPGFQELRFGLRDAKGREIGARAVISLVRFDAIEEGYRGYYYQQAPGHYWSFQPQAMRNGKPFGASQSTRYFDRETERADAIDAYFAGALERAKKIAAA